VGLLIEELRFVNANVVHNYENHIEYSITMKATLSIP